LLLCLLLVASHTTTTTTTTTTTGLSSVVSVPGKISISWPTVLPAFAMAAEAVDLNSDVNENAEASPNIMDSEDNDNNVDDDTMLVRETIEAGRGDRDEQGIRDQWHSDAHIGKDSKFDSRKPISKDIQRLLRAYRLECDGCDHSEAVQKVNAYVLETKRLTQLEEERQQQQQRRDAWARWIFTTIMAVGLSCAYMYRTKWSEALEIIVQLVGEKVNGDGDGLAGFSEAQRAEILRRRRQHAATQRQPQELQNNNDKAVPPTWLDNEKKEVWTSKQEKQFQKALREFGGVSKKERYQLIAAKVDGKSRIECLTHHRMQELLEKQ
jgi:hypothetical protein